MSKFIVCVLALLLTACASLKYTDYERGKVWCSDRYLDKLEKTPFDVLHLDVAERGYIYALAGALVLQKETAEDKQHYFSYPDRLELADKPSRDNSGFEVATFKLYEDNSKTKVKELIIAFTGSNDSDDWFWTNLLFSKSQYKLAEEYVLKISSEYPSYRIVVTGYSLGGGLAVHVTKNENTSSHISETWAFNPSPKIYANDLEDERIWMAAVEGEALSKFRSPFFKWWPGVGKIGSKANHTAEHYYLIQSVSIYGHFRWVLARNMLHAADLAIYKRTNSETTEPLEILQKSHFDACKPSK